MRIPTSFNLTQTGRNLLTNKAKLSKLSQGKTLDHIITNFQGSLPKLAKTTGPKGGRKSAFFGKNRGITSAFDLDTSARIKLDILVKHSNLSRGDAVEHMLRNSDYLYE